MGLLLPHNARSNPNATHLHLSLPPRSCLQPCRRPNTTAKHQDISNAILQAKRRHFCPTSQLVLRPSQRSSLQYGTSGDVNHQPRGMFLAIRIGDVASRWLQREIDHAELLWVSDCSATRNDRWLMGWRAEVPGVAGE